MIRTVRFKQKVYEHCVHLLNGKIHALRTILHELGESSKNDTKSSAGDKHETGRAMIQIEQETIGKQLKEVLEQKILLEKIDPCFNSSLVVKGSMVKTNKGYLFLSIAFGKISVEGKVVMAISPLSPLGVKLMGLRIKDSVEIKGTNYLIEAVS
ncbi:MAG: hypothetical protein HYU69_02820 [Bacteroidetes bacterium]|nr:hypothetical protein [Bacteroidota bacterium]